MKKLLLFSFDKETNVITINCNEIISSKVKIVISDYNIDCPYYVWDTQIYPGFVGWCQPLSPGLFKIVKNNSKFKGYTIRVYNNHNKIIQSEHLCLSNNTEPIINSYFTDPFDCVGSSYIDFFYGKLCDGMNMNGVVVDAGANVGFFTLYAKINGAKRIYSIEPDPSAFYYLQKNYQTDDNIIPIQRVLDTHVGKTIFNINPVDSVGSGEMLSTFTSDFIKSEIDTINIDSILSVEDRINLLKLDIEGSEYRVINEINSEHFNRIDQIFIEFHNYSALLAKKLNSNGYVIEYRNSNENDKYGFIYAKKT